MPRLQKRTFKLIEVLKCCNNAVRIGAEVGVQFGKNARSMLEAFPELQLILVDSYNDNTFQHATHTAQQARDIATVALASFDSRAWWLVMPSVEAAELVDDGSLDYAFIDAGHGYKDVRADLEAWTPKIKLGGVLAGHDYSSRFRGVQRAVDKRFGKIIRQRWGDLWWVLL